MENNTNNTVSYIVYESSQARSERTIKRLIVTLIIITILMFVSNLCLAVGMVKL